MRIVVYYPGCFANYWDPQLGKAVVHVLSQNGFKVIVPKHQCCGVAGMGYGDIKRTRKKAFKLVDILYEEVKLGYDIVTACPSCSLAIKEDYPFLLNNKKAKLVASKTHLLSEYLNALHENNMLNLSFREMPLTIAYHEPCHLKAQGPSGDSIKLMKLIPGLEIINVDRGCCGMSGTAGFKHKYYESSMTIGNALFDKLEESHIQLVATDCGACKLQIEQEGYEVTHPIILLGQAYSI